MHDYIIHASVVVTKDGWTSSIQIPSFVLPSGILGIMGHQQAEVIAKSMLQSIAVEDAVVHVSAAPYEPL